VPPREAALLVRIGEYRELTYSQEQLLSRKEKANEAFGQTLDKLKAAIEGTTQLVRSLRGPVEKTNDKLTHERKLHRTRRKLFRERLKALKGDALRLPETPERDSLVSKIESFQSDSSSSSSSSSSKE